MRFFGRPPTGELPQNDKEVSESGFLEIIRKNMKIFIKAKPNAKKEKIQKISDTNFVVSVCAPPVKGKANQAIIRVLADYFKIPMSRLRIAAGTTSRNKIIEIK